MLAGLDELLRGQENKENQKEDSEADSSSESSDEAGSDLEEENELPED